MAGADRQQVETRPAHVEDWLDSLPYANFEKTTAMLEDALAKTSAVKLKPAIRLQLLDIYWRPYQYLLNTHRKSTSTRDQIKLETIEQRTSGLIKVGLQMAVGSKLGVAEALARKAGLFGSKPPYEFVLLTTKLLGHVILLSYDKYAPPPKGTWKDLHQTFEQSEQLGIADTEFPDPEVDDTCKTTIRNTYLKVLTTALADPHHLPSGAVWHIYEQLDAWVQSIAIKPLQEVKNPAGIFVIVRDSGTAPLSYSKIDRKRLGSQHRLLDCSRLQSAVKSQLTRIHAGQGPDTTLKLPKMLTETLLAHLQRSWGLPPKRYFPRQQRLGNAHITCGMNSVYYYANNETEFTGDIPQQAAPEQEFGDESYASSYTDATAARYAADTWNFVDAGPGGYAIYTKETPKSTIRVGELIGLQDDTGGGKTGWVLGVIRWLIVQSDEAHKIGIQILAKNPRPAAVTVMSKDTSNGETRRAFMIKGTGADSLLALVTPKGYYAVDQALEVEVDAQRLTLRAAELKESAHGFEFFTCR